MPKNAWPFSHGFSACLLLATLPMILGCCGCPLPRPAAGTNPDQQKDEGQTSKADPEIAKLILKELTPSKKFGRTWRAVVVPKGVARDKLIALARQLHRQDQGSWVRFFDDDAEYEKYRLWDEHYAAADREKYTYPKQWSEEHDIALLNLVGDNKGKRWELWAMIPGGLYLMPDDSKSEVIAVIE